MFFSFELSVPFSRGATTEFLALNSDHNSLCLGSNFLGQGYLCYISGVSPWELLMQRNQESAVEYLKTLTNTEEISELLQHRSSLDHSKTLLHLAAQSGSLNSVKAILDLSGQTMRSSLLNIRDGRRRYPIQLAKNTEVSESWNHVTRKFNKNES